jgi:hypothetical protein
MFREGQKVAVIEDKRVLYFDVVLGVGNRMLVLRDGTIYNPRTGRSIGTPRRIEAAK